MKNKIKELLLSTKREGIENLIKHMEEQGFFKAPCSTQYHLSKEGGLAEHSLNVYKQANIFAATCLDPDDYDKMHDSIVITALLHDIGKMGQFNKTNYVPNMLKGRATKANPNPEPYQSTTKPYISNPDLFNVPHEVRSIVIISKFIELTEEEQFAILYHNGMYGDLKYQLNGKETSLYMLLHFADMWASRVVETKESVIEETES